MEELVNTSISFPAIHKLKQSGVCENVFSVDYFQRRQTSITSIITAL